MKAASEDLSVIRYIVSTFGSKKEAGELGERRSKKIKFY
jgi:hypothetical protein